MLIVVSRESDGRESLQDCNGCFSLLLFFLILRRGQERSRLCSCCLKRKEKEEGEKKKKMRAEQICRTESISLFLVCFFFELR